MLFHPSQAHERRLEMEVIRTPIALLALDFDGVLTDNAVYVLQDGQELVRCSRSDGMGLTLLRRAGVRVAVFSTEVNPVVSARCAKLKLECYQGCRDKAGELAQYCDRERLDLEHVIFVGNDVNDLGCFDLVGCAVAVADAHPAVLRRADMVLNRDGGQGAVRELCDVLLQKLELPVDRY